MSGCVSSRNNTWHTGNALSVLVLVTSPNLPFSLLEDPQVPKKLSPAGLSSKD